MEGGSKWGPFISAELLHEFRDGNDVALLIDGEADVFEAKGRGRQRNAESVISGGSGDDFFVARKGDGGQTGRGTAQLE